MQQNIRKNSFLHEFVSKKETKELTLYALALFTLPLFPLNQLIVGTLINAMLIKSAITYKTKKVFLLSLIPSTAVIAGGVLFANLTPQILLMLPFIWLGNFALMFLMRRIHSEKKKDYALFALLSSSVKTMLLFSFAFVFYSQALVPIVFLTMFGLLQFVTAMSGAIVVFGANKLAPKFKV